MPLNNKYYKDNRIPPRGFTNRAFEAVQAAPVGAIYLDGQYWDSTIFRVPRGATNAVVRIYYQTTSKEYVTFLRDENHTNDAGDILYEYWERNGMSPPVLMREAVIGNLAAGMSGDADCDDDVDLDDFRALTGCVTGPGLTLTLGCEAIDADLDSDVDLVDFAEWQLVLTGRE